MQVRRVKPRRPRPLATVPTPPAGDPAFTLVTPVSTVLGVLVFLRFIWLKQVVVRAETC